MAPWAGVSSHLIKERVSKQPSHGRETILTRLSTKDTLQHRPWKDIKKSYHIHIMTSEEQNVLGDIVTCISPSLSLSSSTHWPWVSTAAESPHTCLFLIAFGRAFHKERGQIHTRPRPPWSWCGGGGSLASAAGSGAPPPGSQGQAAGTRYCLLPCSLCVCALQRRKGKIG